jgi:mutator protein MutT
LHFSGHNLPEEDAPGDGWREPNRFSCVKEIVLICLILPKRSKTILTPARMQKVFINNHPLIITGESFRDRVKSGEIFIQYDSPGTLDTILELAHQYENFFTRIYLSGDKPSEIFATLLERSTLIEAAGGLVRNENNELLMIFRNGKWDLPKGKIDKGETPEQAAVREVEEECGIKNLSITNMTEPTWHTYMHHGKLVLKKTHWFEMKFSGSNELKPQEEEGITEVRWMNRQGIEKALENTYNSIAEILRPLIR